MTDGAGLAARAVAISSRTDKPVLDIFSVERRRKAMKVRKRTAKDYRVSRWSGGDQRVFALSGWRKLCRTEFSLAREFGDRRAHRE